MKISTQLNKKNNIKAGIVILFWLLIWQIIAVVVDNKILLSSPIDVILALCSLVTKKSFYKTIVTSVANIMSGYLLAVIVGIVFGMAAHKWSFVYKFISPILSILKSIPVASFVVLLLIWNGSKYLSTEIVFLVTFPNACIHMKNALESVSKSSLETINSLQIKVAKERLLFYKDSIFTFLGNLFETTCGMAFKSGAAAEVIGLAGGTIGERIYMSKVYLETDMLFAWTVILILISIFMEKILLRLLHIASRPVNPAKYFGKIENISLLDEEFLDAAVDFNRLKIDVRNVSKSYGQLNVLKDYSKTFEAGMRYAIMGESGSGKTTLLRLISKIEDVSSGNIEYIEDKSPNVSFMFQDNRLLENEFVLTNIMLSGEKRLSVIEEVIRELFEIDNENYKSVNDLLMEKVTNLSGGMKRRVALIRTMLHASEICILDEPFTGLDDKSKIRAIEFINSHLKGRVLIFTTHNEDDAKALNADIEILK